MPIPEPRQGLRCMDENSVPRPSATCRTVCFFVFSMYAVNKWPSTEVLTLYSSCPFFLPLTFSSPSFCIFFSFLHAAVTKTRPQSGIWALFTRIDTIAVFVCCRFLCLSFFFSHVGKHNCAFVLRATLLSVSLLVLSPILASSCVWIHASQGLGPNKTSKGSRDCSDNPEYA